MARKGGQHGYRTGDIVARIESLRRDAETIEEFSKRCDLNATSLSKWRGGDRISLYSLVRIAEAHPGISLDWLVFGRQVESNIELLDRVASEITDVLNRAYELTPERKMLKLVRRRDPRSPGRGRR